MMPALPTWVGAEPRRAGAERLLGFPEVDALRFPGEPARAVVMGSAGSGKSMLLRHLITLFAEEGTPAVLLRGTEDIEATPADAVLLVDDAHLLDDARLRALARRADDSDTGLIVTARSWPTVPGFVALSRRLERSRPAILLGDVTRHRLREDARSAIGDCEDAVLAMTGGIAWLVHEILRVHDARDCCDDPHHEVLRETLRPRILHRLMSVAPAVRRLIDDLALGLTTEPDVATLGADPESLVAEGYAEGLLTQTGRPPELVAETVRAVAPVALKIHVIEASSPAELHDETLLRSLDGVTDARAADALTARARSLTTEDPSLADELLARAEACGASPESLAEDRAYVAWELGRLDEAGMMLDEQAGTAPPTSRRADLAAAIWADRGMMSLAHDTYQATDGLDRADQTWARLAAIGAGHRIGAPEAGAVERRSAPPSTLHIALRYLERGLAATLSPDAEASALPDLQRASELYTASGDASASVELPAVIAAAATIGLGDLKTADAIIYDALRGGQGGGHRQQRLDLWAAWFALQRERPVEARAALARATSGRALSPRDDAFAATIAVGLARRYDDTAELASVWESARARVVRVEPDLYSLLSLGEAVIAAARLGDAASMHAAFDHGLRIVAQLGEPPAWAAPLHWAGIQRGILLNQPEALAPHARALVAAAAHNRLAARMAQAGRVWTSVLAGTVDPDAVETAARALGTVGLAWDGARLAGHGAGRSNDRKVIARLLACARELHPRDTPRPADAGTTGSTASEASADCLLSDREREVAELVLQGKTYAEIGAAIFISPRTAEHHIAHIRRRLDATSRSDLLSKLRVALEGAPAQPIGVADRRGSHATPHHPPSSIGGIPDAQRGATS